MNKQVIYPYSKINKNIRTHDQFVATAKEVEARLVDSGRNSRSTSINGVKGFSSLLKIFNYPTDVIYDYMHLVCLNHIPGLIKRFVITLSKDQVRDIDEKLSKIRLPHNVNVRYIYSVESVNEWKAKHARLFVLNIGLPILLNQLPKSMISHFSIYCLFIKILHCPRDVDEIRLADQLINYYCRTSSKVYVACSSTFTRASPE